MSFVPFDERLARQKAAGKPPGESTALARLDDLDLDVWTPAMFDEATRVFLAENPLLLELFRSGDALRTLAPGSHFRYQEVYPDLQEYFDEDEAHVGVLVLEGERVIGWGIARDGRESEDGSEIKLIDVDRASRRSAGLASSLRIADREFSVGVGHAIVRGLVREVRRPIVADAETSESRYIFRSLGFRRPTGESNPCIYALD